MRKHLTRIALLASVIVLTTAGIGVDAADLALTPRQKAGAHIVLHQHLRVVRDFDGTPVVMRRLPHSRLYATYVVERATPSHYFNGQPVQPTGRPRF